MSEGTKDVAVPANGSQKRRPPNAGIGRPKGLPNKTTRVLKEAILLAAEQAGGEGGLVEYLRRQALENPGPFIALLGKVLPFQVQGDVGLTVTISRNDAEVL